MSLVLGACAGTQASRENPPPELSRTENAAKESFTRTLHPSEDQYQVEVAIRHLAAPNPSQPEIWLVGAVHLADAAHYRRLQHQLDKADVVLFEQVRDARADKVKSDADTVNENEGYRPYAESLGLQSQLDGIDYSRPNFEWCDMTMQAMLGILEAEVALGGQVGDDAQEAIDAFERLGGHINATSFRARLALFALERSDKVRAQARLMMVKELGNPSKQNEKSRDLPPRLQRLILEDRNAYLVEKIRQRIALRETTGDDSKVLAIYYGAAHLPGIERALVQELGYHAEPHTVWDPAIVVHPRAEGLRDRQVRRIVGDDPPTPIPSQSS